MDREIVDPLLTAMLQIGEDISDLLFISGNPPLVEIHGRLNRFSLGQSSILTPLFIQQLADHLMGGSERLQMEFAAIGSCDCSYAIENLARFRVNIFKQNGRHAIVMRKLQSDVPTLEQLGLPPIFREIVKEKNGIILVTGGTGTGKTTTLAAMIDYINKTKPVHIVTIEDPIEVLHRDEMASINQREIGNDTMDFLSALRAALRQDPDVILIGEMRDTETVRAAIAAAETGHLVLSTLHTVDATETVNRVIDFFPPYQQKQTRLALAGTLRGIICQRLVPTIDGGRVPGLEILINNGLVAERIADPDKTHELKDVIADGSYYGMITFDQSLLQMLKDGRITVEDAMKAVSNQHDFQLAMQQAGMAIPV